jgi:histidinol-phosphate aminotransferase
VSKLGLAGLRLGFLAGDPLLIEQLNKVRLPYNINVLTQATALFALQNDAFLQQQTQAICQSRSELLAALQAIDGVLAYPSAANFILFKTVQHSADAVFASLKQQGILIKNLSPQGGLLANCLRVTVGQASENHAFLQALHKALQIA